MKKTYHINLNHQSFCIDEDAYLQLQQYIETLEKHYLQKEGGQEIIADIESRIAELFREFLQSHHKEVISRTDIDKVVEIMGTPAAIFNEDADTESDINTNRKNRKLYRDPENAILGGVASGLAIYLSVSVGWVRLIFILFLFFYGSALWIYIILWIVLPQAVTVAQKLEMQGEPINVSNIEKNIRDTYNKVKKNSRLHHFTDDLVEGLNRYFTAIGHIGQRILAFIAKFISTIGLIFSILLFISTLIFIICIPENHIAFLQHFSAPVPFWTIRTLLILLFCIPAFLFIYYCSGYLFRFQLHKIVLFCSLGIWLPCIFITIILGIYFSSQFSDYSRERTELSLAPTDSNSKILYVRFDNSNAPDPVPGQFNLWHNLYYYTKSNPADSSRLYFCPDISFQASKDSIPTPRVIITRSACGPNKMATHQSIENTRYNYIWENDTLNLSTYFTLQHPVYRENKVKVVVTLPENYRLQLLNFIPYTVNSYNFQGSKKYWKTLPHDRLYIMKNGQLVN